MLCTLPTIPTQAHTFSYLLPALLIKEKTRNTTLKVNKFVEPFVLPYLGSFSLASVSVRSAVRHLQPNLYQNLHGKLGQQAPSFGSILAYLETTARVRSCEY